MSITQVIEEAVEHTEDSAKAFGNRCSDVFKAVSKGLLTFLEVQRLMQNIVEFQIEKEIIRSDRYIPKYDEETVTPEQKKAYVIAEKLNWEGEKAKEKLKLFKEQHGLEMSEKERVWFDYVMTGYADSPEIKEYRGELIEDYAAAPF